MCVINISEKMIGSASLHPFVNWGGFSDSESNGYLGFPWEVLEVLQTEIRSAQRCLAAVLRRSTRSLQECLVHTVAAMAQDMSRYLMSRMTPEMDQHR